MKKHVFLLVIIFFTLLASHIPLYSTTEENIASIPVLYKGRIRPLESCARLWLKEYYNAEEILPEHTQFFKSRNALELLLTVHFLGTSYLENTPLFWIGNEKLKEVLSLNKEKSRFSFKELKHSIFMQKETNLKLIKRLVVDALQKTGYVSSENRSNIVELASLHPGLKIKIKKNQILLMTAPKDSLWGFLHDGFVIDDDASSSMLKPTDPNFFTESLALLSKLKQFNPMRTSPQLDLESRLRELKELKPTEIQHILESEFPLSTRLSESDSLLKTLPGYSGEWFSLKSLKETTYDPKIQFFVPSGNFTVYNTPLFQKIRESYLSLEKAFLQGNVSEQYQSSDLLAQQLFEGYKELESKPYKIAEGKNLLYPTINQLHAELYYHRIPFKEILLILYTFSIFSIILSFKYPKGNFLVIVPIITAFILHTALLAIRCYILNRPPVSNMEETIIYVPWISVLTGLLFYIFTKRKLILLSASLVGTLLWILRFSYAYSSLDNVQAVLDSQYWLIVHVMLVVGSYGVFVFSATLSHIYLGLYCFYPNSTRILPVISKCLLQTLYLGVAMLISGTLLGGVWAAESWGRFWDWDPKESWAFISICTYLLWIHAYRFKYVHEFGLAIGAIIGWLSISFTWYGVNYILGTGMHSYGFGSGGEKYYYGFLVAELAFLMFVSFWKQKKNRLNPT